MVFPQCVLRVTSLSLPCHFSSLPLLYRYAANPGPLSQTSNCLRFLDNLRQPGSSSPGCRWWTLLRGGSGLHTRIFPRQRVQHARLEFVTESRQFAKEGWSPSDGLFILIVFGKILYWTPGLSCADAHRPQQLAELEDR